MRVYGSSTISQYVLMYVYHWSVYVGYAQISQLNTLIKQVLDVAKATIEAASVLMATQDSTSAESTRTNMEVGPC